MSGVREINLLGHPILRQTAQPIHNFGTPQLEQLIEDLLLTVIAANGVGISAPQVSEPLRLFIVASHPNPRYPDAPTMSPIVMLNPKLIAHSTEMVKDWEGCLSIPGQRGLVPRYREIEVEYLDRRGQLQQQVFRDFVARIFQHELDHLDGKVFWDRIDPSQELEPGKPKVNGGRRQEGTL